MKVSILFSFITDHLGPGKMTDWRDIVGMIETFCDVFRLRHSASNSRAEASYPPVPAAINPTPGKRVSAATSNSTSSNETEGSEESREGYSGQLSSSRAPSQTGRTLATQASGSLQWHETWPEL